MLLVNREVHSQKNPFYPSLYTGTTSENFSSFEIFSKEASEYATKLLDNSEWYIQGRAERCVCVCVCGGGGGGAGVTPNLPDII